MALNELHIALKPDIRKWMLSVRPHLYGLWLILKLLRYINTFIVFIRCERLDRWGETGKKT